MKKNEIRRMISEGIRNILNESLTSIVYHFTYMDSFAKIMDENRFSLTEDEFTKDKSKRFYMCFTRQKYGDTGLSIARRWPIRITIDGDALNNRYRSEPYEFWYHSEKKTAYEKDLGYDGKMPYRQVHQENQDRLFSPNRYIDDALKYILRVDVCIPKMKCPIDLITQRELNYLDDIISGKKLEGKIFIYEDEEEFNLQSNKHVDAERYSNIWKERIKSGTYDHVGDEHDGMRMVRTNGKFNFIDSENRLLSKEWFDHAFDFNEGYASVMYGYGKHNLIGTDGRFFFPKNNGLRKASGFENGYSIISYDIKKETYIRKDGSRLFDTWFSQCGPFSDDGTAYVNINGKTMRINEKGERVN